VRRPDQIAEQLRRRFDQDYPDWARGRGRWPMRISLQPPSTAERSTDPVACHDWAAQWRAYPGPGTVEYQNLRFPTGIHPMPHALVLHRPDVVAAAHPDTEQTWRRCGQRLIALQRTFPRARFDGIIRRITELDARDYDRLTNTVTWLRENPTSGMLLRQLPIEGIDTKWLARHAYLVLAILDTDDPDEDGDLTEGPRRLRLYRRLGLRVPPDLVQVAVLDPRLRAGLGGMRHFAASIDDLNAWPSRPRTVVILENKETGYALTDDLTDVVALHGEGFSVLHYARITWVRDAEKVVYWGDIDTAGLQFVNDLRGYGTNVRTVLMDIDTLNRFRHLAVDGALPQRARVPLLTAEEHSLYQHLVDYATTNEVGLLLEQERIPWQHAYPILDAAIAALANPVPTFACLDLRE
jgi:hypothetical protein